MAKPTLLIADSDARSLGILELALRKAGFAIETADSGEQALDRIRAAKPDLAILDAALPGVKLCKTLRAEGAEVALLVIGADKAQAAKALDAGADDFLAKPIILKELSRRVHALLEQRQRPASGSEAMSGSLRELGLFDVFGALQAAGKSAIVHCEAYGRDARVFLDKGEIADAELGSLQGEAALWRLLTWESGAFRAEFAPFDREMRIEGGTQAALKRGLEQIERLGKATVELPMTTQLAVDYAKLAEALADLPDEVNGVMRAFDGKRTLREAVDLSPVDDLATLAVVRRLMDDGLLAAVGSTKQAIDAPKKPSLEQWLSTPPPPVAAKTLDEARAAAALVQELATVEAVEADRAQAQVVTDKIRVPVKPVPVLRFPPLRGVRRERLRREAEEARARIAAGNPVRLSHVVELPPRGEVEALDGARRMSPAVGDAAKKFAPDAPVARVVAGPVEAFPAQVPTPPIAPVAAATPPPPEPAAIVPGTPAPQAALPQKKKRWPLYTAVAAAMLLGAWLMRPQPQTDKKDAPWLPPKPAAAPVPEAPPQVPPVVATAVVAPPPPPPPPPEDGYAKALAEGDDLVKKGKYRAAIGRFQAAVKERPQSVPALLALGDAFLESDKPRSALQPLEAAAKLDARSSRAQLLLGTAYQSLGRNPQAVKAYQRYLELEPSGEFVKDVRLILANLKHSG